MVKRAISKIFLLTIILAGLSAIIEAQPTSRQTPPAALKFAGENLKYEGKIDKILRGITVAELTFNTSLDSGSERLLVKSTAVSKGTLLKLFRFSFLQEYQSLLSLEPFRILKTNKHDVQKQRVRDSEAVFNYADRLVTYVETDPKDLMRPPRRIASEIGEQMHDMISAIYSVRLLPLAVGQRFEVTVSDSGLVFKIPFAVVSRQVQSTILGKISCFRIEPEIFGPGRLIEQKGKMVIWVTEDDRHLPVRAEVNTEIGKVNIKLKTYSKTSPRA